MAEKANLRPGDAANDFLHRFFHDLATPLSAVSLHLEGADRKVRRGADPKESLAIARAELSRAFDLFEQGRQCLLEPEEPSTVLAFDDFVDGVIRQNFDSAVSLSGSTGGQVAGDPRALGEALRALIANALEASGSGAVSVHRERGEGVLRVWVENPGRLPGADPDALFSPRTAGPGRNWGMGLPRARLRAATAGGVIRLEQGEGRVRALLELPEVPH